MIWVVWIFSVLCIVTGIYALKRNKKFVGIMELLSAIICPYITVAFGNLQTSHAFGGTKFEFFVASASDGCIEPWILLFLTIVEVICIVINVYDYIKEINR